MKAHPSTRVRHALLHTLDEEGSRLFGAWPEARRGSAEALRQARVATRRLRQVLAVTSQITAGRRSEALMRDLRTIARLCGPLRDLAMAVDFLTPYEARADIGSAARAVKIVLDADRAQVFADARKATRRVPIARIERGLTALKKAIAKREDSPAWTRALMTVIARRTVEVGDALARSSALYEPDRLHALRIAIKKLRYAVEVAAAASLVPRAIATSLARHQKRLGAWHDRVAVLDLLRRRQAASIVPSASAWGPLADFLDREAHVLHGQLRRGRQNLERHLADLRSRMAVATVVNIRLHPARAALVRPDRRHLTVRRSG